MRDATLVFPVRSGEVLLGLKKRGFGEGKWNGFGGKVEDERIRDAAVRELEEESGLRATPSDLEDAGIIVFRFIDQPEWDLRVHVFVLERYTGCVTESEEMRPEWFSKTQVPFDVMWEDDRHWLPYVLERRSVEGSFSFHKNRIVSFELTISEQL